MSIAASAVLHRFGASAAARGEASGSSTNGPPGGTCSGLLRRVRDRRDDASWNEFFGLYEPLVLNYVRSHGVPQHDAQDVVQEVMISLMRKLPQFTLDHGRGRFRTWLWKVTHHAVINWRRRLRRQRDIERIQRERVAAVPLNFPAKSDQSNVENERLQAALEAARKISSRLNWTCFEMRLLQGRPAAEIAKQLGIPANSVYVYASRVLATVREEAARGEVESHE
jgi:RNA polymerase sigma-70 factor (ECF subfamily)